MSLLKNRYYFAVLAIAALVVTYYLFISSAIWAMVLCILVPLASSVSIHKFLQEHDYKEDFVNAEWSSNEP